MLGTLTTEQSKYILCSNHIGRIGCLADGKMLIVPITYVSDGKCIYAHSLEGTKIKVMRTNPNVCFEVDCIDDLANWRSVIVVGRFEELKKYAAQSKAKRMFFERLHPLTLGETVNSIRETSRPPETVHKKKRPVLFRITVKEISGRYEKQAEN